MIQIITFTFMRKAKILIVDDDQDVLDTARIILKPEFSQVDMLQDPSRLPGSVTRENYDLILLDMNFRKGLNQGREGLYWLERILEIDPEAIVILITAYAEVDLAVNAIKHGATDFIMKPWKNQKLIATLHAALRLRESEREVRRMKDTQHHIQDVTDKPYQDFIGDSPPVQRIREIIARVAGTDASVLIMGENGTGKELVARAVHRQSQRSNHAFISVDLGALAPTLWESELFGYVKGAFTDAREDKTGKIRAADQGTLFLDEIGNIPPESQIKLLRTLQTREVTPVGKTTGEQVDFRLISATNMPLHEMVSENRFREDLLYRINTVEIWLPALRDRRDDIALLAAHFLENFSSRYRKKDLQFHDDALDAMHAYHWPGNIRELQHAVERAVIMSDRQKITPDDLFARRTGTRPSSGILTLDEKEKEYIQEVLARHEGNVTRTASALGLTRTALYRRLNKYGIQ